jgi:hypothetical protein
MSATADREQAADPLTADRTGVGARARTRRAVVTAIVVGAVAVCAVAVAVVALTAGGSAAARPTKPEPNQCVVESDSPQPPHLVDLCHWDAGRQAWVRQYHGHAVVASTIPHQTSMMCLWLGCPKDAPSRKRG